LFSGPYYAEPLDKKPGASGQNELLRQPRGNSLPPRTGIVFEPALSSPRSPPKPASPAAFGSLHSVTELQRPVLLKPRYIPLRRHDAEDSGLGGPSGTTSGVEEIAESLTSLEATSNVRASSIANSDETENGESWSSAGELDCQRPPLDIEAREKTELALETFWDLFNKHREELCRQRATADQQAPTSTPVSLSTKSHAAGSSGASGFPQQRGKSHSRPGDDEDDGRLPKRGRIDSNLPPDRAENPRFSCPYRKHNRQRYNIHTHRTCALSCFNTISRVK
jgi:hypothetical protein